MKAVTAAQIFMFTFVGYCILVMDDSPRRFERGAQVFKQWTSVSAAKAGVFGDEVAFEARESVRAVGKVLQPMGLDRGMNAVRQHVTRRATLFRSYAIERLALDLSSREES